MHSGVIDSTISIYITVSSIWTSYALKLSASSYHSKQTHIIETCGFHDKP